MKRESIQYMLVKNPLTEDPEDFMARVQPNSTADLEYIIKHVLMRSTTVGEADIRGVLVDYHDIIENLIQEGVNVTTPTANYRVSVTGRFHGRDDSFEPGRHRLTARLSPGVRIRQAISGKLQLVKVQPDKPRPKLLDYIDVASGERNGTVTPGGLGKLSGERLRFDGEDPEQGIFFIALADNSETRVESVAENLPGKLIFLVPSLPAGEYELEVRAAIHDKLRTGRLEETLTVL